MKFLQKTNLMIKKLFFSGLILLLLFQCKNAENDNSYADVNIASAMRNVMWKGELEGKINLDTISNKKGLYGLGPVSFLQGELLINNGKSYVSKVTSDSTMIVEKTFDVSAPFFVYATVDEWEQIELPSNIKIIKEVENFIDNKTRERKRPFPFKLIGSVKSAPLSTINRRST